MNRWFFRVGLFLSLLESFQLNTAHGVEETAKPLNSTSESPQDLVARLKKSLVTIRSMGRDGGEVGLGTGFVIDESGLIATNFHVVGEGRPIRVELGNRQSLKVLAVEASSRSRDLAVLRVDLGDQVLTPLPLASGETVEPGTTVLAFGNPFGLRQSVVQGIVSAVREIEQQELIQIAIPIEPGNSGGPLVDMHGDVHGIVNMKSAVSKNVGFAIPVQKLRELVNDPNPVSMDRWVRLSEIDPKQWKVPSGGEWFERHSTIRVSGNGNGFGGRTLCLRQEDAPQSRFELSVEVKLDDESGAAGLTFRSDGLDRHYGFYPSNGKLRLTCFLGPNVMNWQVVREVSTIHYVRDQWNALRVRVDGERIQGFVNGQLVVDENHQGLKSGSVGLAAFRGTSAQFRKFSVATSLSELPLSTATNEWLKRVASDSSLATIEKLSKLPGLADESNRISMELQRQAESIQKKADAFKRLSEDALRLPILDRLQRQFEGEDENDLLEGALLIAALDHPDLSVEQYVARVDEMAEEIKRTLPKKPTDNDRLTSLNRFLFEENGYRGGIDEYYHPANNHLDRVIDDREGMPITLSILYIEIGRRIGLKLEGVGLPGHFVVRYRKNSKESKLLDVFDKAKILTETDVAMMVMMHAQRLTTDDDLRPQTNKEILTRVLRNLSNSANEAEDRDSYHQYCEGLAVLHAEVPAYRWQRAWSRYQTGRLSAAITDFNWLIEQQPEGIELKELFRLREQIASQIEN
jgi:serine protease Do